MDFHNMKRKELQQLCKKHKLPANLSNFEMVDTLSSLFKVQEEEKEKPVRKTRSCLKNSDEMLSENESDISKKNVKKVRFNPESDVFQLGEKSERGFAVENKGGAGRVTRGRASLLCKTVLISPVVMKKKGKRAVQDVEKEDLVIENKGGVSRVTRARASLGKNVVVSSPVVMKKRAQRAVQEVEKKDLDVESKGGVSRVTRTRALVGEKVLIPSPVVMKKRGKKVVQEDEKGDSLVENQGGASRVTRARAGKQVLISSPVVMKKRGKRAVQEEKKSGSAPLLVVDLTNPAAEEENEVISVKFLRNRKVENVASSKNIVRKSNTQKRSPNLGLRRSTRNANMSEESEGLMDETDQKVSRENLRQSTRQRASAKSSIEDVDKNTIGVEISQPVVVTRQSKRNRQSTDESTRCQTRHGTKRMSVMPRMKKAKTEKPVAGNLGKKNIVVKDSPEESTKPIVVEKGSEFGHIRRSKRNASGDGSLVIAEDANDCGTDIKTVTTKKRRRDAVLEEVPSQYTGRRVNRKADNISDKPKEETPVASEPRTRSGNRQASLMHSAKKFNMSGNMGPCGTTGEKASPHYTREPSTVPKRSATGARQSKTVAVTPQTRSGSGQKSFIHTTKKLRMSGNSGLHKTLGDNESPHQSREISFASRCSGTESKGRGSKSKQTPVIHEHSRRFTRSALKGKTDGPAHVRGKIYQKKSRSVSKLPLSKVEVDRSTVNLVSSASDLPENKTACSTPQGGSAKTNSVDLYVQESEGPEMINIHEVSPSDPLNSQSNHVELEVDISTLQGGSPKTSTVDLNLQESEGPELMNVREASPSDPLNFLSNNAGIEMDISTPQGGSPKTRSVDLNVQESEGPELINICEALPSNPLILQSIHAELEMDISTPQGSSPKTSSVDLNVQESEGPDLINIREASPGDPLNVQSNHAEFEVDISTPQGGSPETSSVDLNVQESEGPELINIREASPSDTLNLLSNHAVHGDVNEDNTTGTQHENFCKTNVASPHLVHLKADAAAGDVFPADANLTDISLVDQSISTRTEERPELSNDVESISKGIDLNFIFQGPAIHEDEPVYRSPLPKVAEMADNSVTGKSDAACVTQQEGPTEVDAKSPPLDTSNNSVTSKSDAACVTQQEGPTEVDAKSPPLDTSKSDAACVTQQEGPTEVDAKSPVTSKSDAACVTQQEGPTEVDATSPPLDTSKSDAACVTQQEGPTEVDAKSPVTSMSDATCVTQQEGPIEVETKSPPLDTSKSDAACATQQEGPTEVDAKSPPLDHLMSADNIDITGDAGSIDTDYVDDYHLNVEHIISSAIKEKLQEVSENVNHVVAEGSTVNEVNSTAEVGDCGPTEQENDICKNPVEFPESGRLDKDSKSAPKEVGEVVSSADILFQTVSMNFTVDKDDKMHPEISVQADEPHNTSSKSGMQEKEFPVPNSIANTEDVSILEYEFSKPEFSDTVTSTVMCINKELEEDSNQRLSTVESFLMREESGTKICTEFSTSNVVADSVAGENNKSQPRAPSSPLRATEFDNIVVEVNEELKPEDSPLSWRSDIFERAAVDGSSLQKEHNLAKSTDVSEHNHSKNAEVKFENRKKVGAFDSTTREMSDMPEFTSSLPSHGTELGHLVAEVKEVEPKDSSSLWSTENVPKRTAEGGRSLHKQVGIEGREVEETVFEDTVENASERTSSMFGDAHHILDGQQPTERECDLGEMTCSISGDVEERRMNENISRERTLVISKHDVDRGNISSPVIAHEFPSSVDDHCHTPSEESCGKEQDMSMVKSSKNFGKEFSSQHDYFYGQLKDSCGKEQGTPMSIVKSSKYCGEEFSGQHDKIIEQVKVCSTAALPQTICEDFAGFDNQMLPDLMGSTGRRISWTGDLNIVKFEETEPSTVITDKIVDGIESLKENSSTLVRNLVEDSGGYCEKSDANIATHDISEEDCYGKDAIDSYQIEDTVQQFQIDSNFKVILQENDARPYVLQMDVDTINVEHSRDNLIASDTIHRFDQEADASGMPMEKLPRYEEPMDADAPANLQYGGESVTLTGETNKAQGVPTEELTRTEYAMDADAPANLQYGNQEADASGMPTEELPPRYEEPMDADAPANLQYDGESATLTGETNKAQGVPTEELTRTEYAMDADAPANLQYGNQEADASGMPTEELPRYEEPMDADASANLQYGGEGVTLTGETNKAQGVPTEELTRTEDAMDADAPAILQYGNQEAVASGMPTDADAPANLQYGGESVNLTGETNKAQGVPTEELTRTEDAMDADAPANLHYGRESLTIPGETNQAQERGPVDISFCSDIFGPELNSRSDEVDGGESHLWFENSSFPGIELDSFMVSPTKEQLQNSGEKHAREKDPESIENQHAAFNNPSTGVDNVSVENSVGTLNESHIESEANKSTSKS